jgi:hypothetical protein
LLTFLKFLVAVVLTVIVLIVLVILWFKRKIGKAVSMATTALQLQEPAIARITLHHDAEPAEPADDAQGLQMRCELTASGFIALGDFRSDGIATVAAYTHPELHVVAAVIAPDGSNHHCEYYALGKDGRARVLTTEPGAEPLELRSLNVHPVRDLTPRQAIATLVPEGAELRGMDAATFVLFHERLFATRMDHRLRTPPTIDSLLRHARAKGKSPELTDAEKATALEFAQAAWRNAVEVAIKDNARRQLRLTSEDWARIEEHICVMHAHMDADQAIEAHQGDALIERLGAQLKLQHLTPSQIFDEINRRRPVASRLQAIATVGMPVHATVYATTAALRSVGLGDLGLSRAQGA